MKSKYVPQMQQMRSFLNEVTPEGGLERLADDESRLEEMAPAIDKLARDDHEAELARTAVRMLARNEELPPELRSAHEAIILPQLRPVIDIVNNTFEAPPGQWQHLGEDVYRAQIEAVIPSIGRLELPNDPLHPFVGTGFVVGRDLLMTNRHVADIFCTGLGVQGLRFRPGRSAGIDFLEENADTGSLFIDILEIVMVHPYWDMALLRVNELPEVQIPLCFSLEDPQDLTEREMVVIGYPAFDERNDADLQNRIFRGVFNVKRLQPGTLTGRKTVRSFENLVSALKHNASTLGGNSGSAIVDIKTGEVLGLHFAGVYMDSNYAVPAYDLSLDRRVVDAGVIFCGQPSPSASLSWEARWRAADPQDLIVDLIGSAGLGDDPSRPSASGPFVTVQGENATWNIPVQITVTVGKPSLATIGGAAPVKPTEVEAPPTTPDQDYTNRKGYDENFLPGHQVRIPWLTDEQYQNTVRPSVSGFPRHVLPYHHFSLVMNRERRVAYFTAVNIDGDREVHVVRSEFRDDWALDPRIDASVQMDNDYYKDKSGVKNPLDRGHLVRRLDPCWGDTRDEVIKAHHDTFHYTNCSPQHKGFNRTETFWAGIENYILENANAEDARVTVFTGPVFRDDDPVYMAPTGVQLQIPLEFWKVVAWVRADGSLASSGYLLSQNGQIDQMLEVQFGPYREYQVAISEIEQVTDLSFRGLADLDVFAGSNEALAGQRREIHSFEDVIY